MLIDPPIKDSHSPLLGDVSISGKPDEKSTQASSQKKDTKKDTYGFPPRKNASAGGISAFNQFIDDYSPAQISGVNHNGSFADMFEGHEQNITSLTNLSLLAGDFYAFGQYVDRIWKNSDEAKAFHNKLDQDPTAVPQGLINWVMQNTSIQDVEKAKRFVRAGRKIKDTDVQEILAYTEFKKAISKMALARISAYARYINKSNADSVSLAAGPR